MVSSVRFIGLCVCVCLAFGFEGKPMPRRSGATVWRQRRRFAAKRFLKKSFGAFRSQSF
jgi:hypothetical protein